MAIRPASRALRAPAIAATPMFGLAAPRNPSQGTSRPHATSGGHWTAFTQAMNDPLRKKASRPGPSRVSTNARIAAGSAANSTRATGSGSKPRGSTDSGAMSG